MTHDEMATTSMLKSSDEFICVWARSLEAGYTREAVVGHHAMTLEVGAEPFGKAGKNHRLRDLQAALGNSLEVVGRAAHQRLG